MIWRGKNQRGQRSSQHKRFGILALEASEVEVKVSQTLAIESFDSLASRAQVKMQVKVTDGFT